MTWSNDNLAGAAALAGASGSITPLTYDSTVDPATSETGESVYGAGETLWWKWTAPSSGTYSFDTLGSPSADADPNGLDTKMQVFSGPSSSPTHAALTLIGSNDDSGTGAAYPYNSQVIFTAVSGTTYYVQVDFYATGEAGMLHLAWVYHPPAPTASTWTDLTSGSRGARTMWAGDDIEVVGTHLDTVTTASVGGVAQPFTITDSTHLTIHVTSTAVNGAVVVANVSGSATATNSGFGTAIVYYPGPWVIPPDLTATDVSVPSGNTATYDQAGTVGSTQPDLAGTPYSGIGGVYGLTAEGGTLSSTTVTWDVTGVVVVLDERDPVAAGVVTDYVPTAEIAADPHAVDYDTLTSDTPVATSDVTVTFDVQTGGTAGKSTGQDNEDSNGRSLSGDLWQANLEYRRLPDSEWAFDGIIPKLNSGVWPSKAHVAALPLDFTRSALNPGASLTITSAAPWTNNRATLADGAAVGPQGPLDVVWTDFGTARAWLVALSPLIDGTAITAPVIDPTPASRTGSVKQLDRTATVRGQWTYRPRRYRLIYDTPRVVTTGWQVGSVALT